VATVTTSCWLDGSLGRYPGQAGANDGRPQSSSM
jgi:hypothetical protein